MTGKAKRRSREHYSAGAVSSCSYFLLPAASLCTGALKARFLCILLGPVAKGDICLPQQLGASF